MTYLTPLSRRLVFALTVSACLPALIVSCYASRAVIIPPPDDFVYSPCPEGMVFIPAASFDYGPANPDIDGAEPLNIKLPAFCIDRLPTLDAPDGPKKLLTYFDAKQACAARGDGYRLSTEQEWERACRGDDLTAYPYGNAYQPGRCIAATDAPIGSTSRCVSSFGIIGLTDGAGEWTLGGDWAPEELDRTLVRRAVIRGLGTGESRRCVHRVEVGLGAADIAGTDNSSETLPIIDEASASSLRFETAPTAIADGIYIGVQKPEGFDAPAEQPFSSLRTGASRVSALQGFRCSRSATLVKQSPSGN